jgi:hypothetical protein
MTQQTPDVFELCRLYGRNLLDSRIGIEVPPMNIEKDVVLSVAQQRLPDKIYHMLKANIMASYDAYLQQGLSNRKADDPTADIDEWDRRLYLPDDYLSRRVVAAAYYCFKAYGVIPTAELAIMFNKPPLKPIYVDNKELFPVRGKRPVSSTPKSLVQPTPVAQKKPRKALVVAPRQMMTALDWHFQPSAFDKPNLPIRIPKSRSLAAKRTLAAAPAKASRAYIPFKKNETPI